MKVIVHAPSYMVERAAGIAAQQMYSGALLENSLIGIISGNNCFTIKRNKASVSVWWFAKPDGQPDPDRWEAQ